MRKTKRKLTKKQMSNLRNRIEPVLSIFDQTNKLLKLKFEIEDAKGLNYITDNGIIKNGWLLSDKQNIKDATTVLEKQNAPVYILGKFYGAAFSWDALRSVVVCSLWRNSKKVDEFRSLNMSEIASTMTDWFEKVTKGDKNGGV
jgi:hypothetical protein